MKKYGQKVLLTYGGGSIKRNGLYDRIIEQLKEIGIEWEELSGIEPNPRIETVRKGADLCKEKHIDVLLAVGGGSTIDATKWMAAGACSEHDPWDFLKDPSIPVDNALPVLSVLTIAAIGSEMDAGGVITNLETNDKLGRIHSFRHANGKFLLMGCTLSCAGSLNWWFKDVLNIKNYDDEFENVDINNMNDILFLPYLMGERSPINDPNAKGMFANLNAIYKRADMTKAVVEGISYSLYDVFSIMKDLNLDFKEARVIGGGSRNKKWMQLLADIFGIKIKTISTSDGGALGAIILAMYGDKQYKYLKEACDELVHDKDIYMPNLKNHIIYQKKFEQYRQLYLKNKN